MAKLYRFPAQQLPFDHSESFIAQVPPHRNPYQKIHIGVDFEHYRSIVEAAVERDRIAKNPTRTKPLSKAGRRAVDPVFALKCLFVQRAFNLSDEAMEVAMGTDRLLQDHLKIGAPGDVLKRQTLWKYREIFAREGVFETIFNKHVAHLKTIKSEIETRAIIIDSSFIEARKQRNSREDNATIKEGKGHTLWCDQPRKKCQKDIDARWTKKRGEVHYGYKMHCIACAVNKLITKIHVTPASVHDAAVVGELVSYNEEVRIFYADAGYVGKPIEKIVAKCNMIPKICSKGYRNHPLTEAQKAENKVISSTRCRIEHIFGYIEGAMRGSTVRSVGMVRAKANAALTAFVYNVFRVPQVLL